MSYENYIPKELSFYSRFFNKEGATLPSVYDEKNRPLCITSMDVVLQGEKDKEKPSLDNVKSSYNVAICRYKSNEDSFKWIPFYVIGIDNLGIKRRILVFKSSKKNIDFYMGAKEEFSAVKKGEKGNEIYSYNSANIRGSIENVNLYFPEKNNKSVTEKWETLRNTYSPSFISFSIDSAHFNEKNSEIPPVPYSSYLGRIYFDYYDQSNNSIIMYKENSNFPTFNVTDINSIMAYLDDGDRSGEVYIGKKGTDWSVYIDGKKNPLLHIYWKNKYFEDLFKKDLTPDMVTTKIWIEVPVIDMGVETGEVKKVSLYSGSYRPHPFDTSFKSIFKKADPKAYNSLLDGLLNPLETRQFKVCMKNEYWEKTSGQKRDTDTVFFWIDNHGEVKSYGVIPDAEPDESTIEIKKGAGVNPDDTYKPIPDGSDVKDGDTASGNGSNNLGLLTTTYKLTAARLKGLGGFLWGGLIDSIKLVNNNPIENIVSCKIIPVATGGTDKNIYLGNVNTNIMGEVVTGHKKVTLGSIPVKEFYGSFLDYAPFTKISIFIPFIGFKELDTSLYMGKNISVEYIVDMITGSCKALLYANGIYCQSYDGNCGIDIPLTSNNRAQVEAAYIGGAIGTVGEIAGKDVLGALDSMLNTAVTPYHYNTSGTYSPTCGSFETRLCYLIIDRPTFQLPTSYGHDRGYPCELSRSIGSVSGFTVVDSGVDLSGISCTDNERDIIRTLLTSGFYA